MTTPEETSDMTQPTGPQDAAPGQPWPGWPQAPDASPSAGPSRAGTGPSDPQPSGAAETWDSGASVNRDTAAAAAAGGPRAPDGPNWALAAVGFLLLAVAGAQLAYLLGYRTDASLQLGPQALVATGAVLVLVGAAGLIGRRTAAANRRRRRATTRR